MLHYESSSDSSKDDFVKHICAVYSLPYLLQMLFYVILCCLIGYLIVKLDIVQLWYHVDCEWHLSTCEFQVFKMYGAYLSENLITLTRKFYIRLKIHHVICNSAALRALLWAVSYILFVTDIRYNDYE